VERHWTPQEALNRAREILHEEGLRALWFKVLGEICYRRVMVLHLALDTLPERHPCDENVRLEMLSEDKIADYLTLRPDADPKEIRSRLRRGFLCRLGRYAGEVVYAAWFAPNRCRVAYLGVEVGVASGVLYGHEVYVKPAFRRRGVASQMIWQGGRLFREMGYSRIVAVVVPENTAALRLHSKNGYRLAGWIHSVWLGPWRRDWLTVREKPAPISLIRAHSPPRCSGE